MKQTLTIAAAALTLAAGPAFAQQAGQPAVAAPQPAAPVSPGTACPAGTRYAAIRHSIVKPGKWSVFVKTVAEHGAWYARQGSATTTQLVRVIGRTLTGPTLVETEAVTLTLYDPARPQPPQDDAYRAFVAAYADSSELKDEARVCLPAL